MDIGVSDFSAAADDGIKSLARPLVLLATGDAAASARLRPALEKRGFSVDGAADGAGALAYTALHTPDLVLLDWALSGVSGLDVCRHIRCRPTTRNVPVIMIIKRSMDRQILHGLNTGADDFVTKPLEERALLARMRQLLRPSAALPLRGRLITRDITMDLATRRVQRGGRAVHLGPIEFRLLELLLQHLGRVLSRQEILQVIWGQNIHVETRTVDAHIRRLRKSINGTGEFDLVRTVRLAGYALDTKPM